MPPLLIFFSFLRRFTQQMWYEQQLRLVTVFLFSVAWVKCNEDRVPVFCRQANGEDVKTRPAFRYAGDSCLDNEASSEIAHRRKYALCDIQIPYFRYLLLGLPNHVLPIRATCSANCTILPVMWCPELFTSSFQAKIFSWPVLVSETCDSFSCPKVRNCVSLPYKTAGSIAVLKVQ